MRKILALFLLLFNFQMCFASLKVSPTIIELNANKTRNNYITASFNVRGDASETVRFKIYPSYFEITEDGKMNEIPVSNSVNSLVNNARIIPNEFTLKNGMSQKVRLTIANVKKLPDGESRMVLFLEDVKPKELILPYYKEDVVTKIIVKSRIGIPVYVDKGRFIKCAEFQSLKVQNVDDNLSFKLNLLSKGNSKVRYKGKAQIIKDKKLISEHPISQNTVKNNGKISVIENIPIKNIKENGNYTLRVIVNYENEKGDLKNLIEETDFTVSNVETKI